MSILSFIIWSPNPEIFPGISWIPVRWYGLLFAMAFIVGQQIYLYIYKKEGKPEKDVETLTIYLVIATIIGARLGHVLFYELLVKSSLCGSIPVAFYLNAECQDTAVFISSLNPYVCTAARLAILEKLVADMHLAVDNDISC